MGWEGRKQQGRARVKRSEQNPCTRRGGERRAPVVRGRRPRSAPAQAARPSVWPFAACPPMVSGAA
jgi:hypothetical protein